MKNVKLIYVKGLAEEENSHVGFYDSFSVDSKNTYCIHITGKSFYRLFINGAFVFHGPARSVHNYARVDKIDISKYVQQGINHIGIECCNYLGRDIALGYTTGETGFICFELFENGNSISSSSKDTKSINLYQRVLLGNRYSHSRPVVEQYIIDDVYYDYKIGNIDDEAWNETEIIDKKITFWDRGVEYPDLTLSDMPKLIEFGSVKVDRDIEVPIHFYEYDVKTERNKLPSNECYQSVHLPSGSRVNKKQNGYNTEYDVIVDNSGDKGVDGYYFLFDLKKMHSGFKGVTLRLTSEATIDILHSDFLDEGRLDPKPITNNCIRIKTSKERVDFTSFEPYGIKYIEVIVRTKTSFVLENVFVRNYQYKDVGMTSFTCSDEKLNRIYDSAKATLLLNTLDVFMDCPDRERGGWFCDSLFTARAANLMLGDDGVQKAMLENVIVSPRDTMLIDLFPCQYPSNMHDKENNIFTWSLYLIIELYEYVSRTNDSKILELAKDRIEAIISGIESYENNSGLIDSIPQSIFIDWSISNSPQHTTPISVPTNALYSKVLILCSKMYGREDWKEKGELIKKSLLDKAVVKGWMGEELITDSLQIDNEGKLISNNFFSEAGHYTCAFADMMSKDDNNLLSDCMVEKFGVKPQKGMDFITVGKANIFIGLCLRMDMLSKWDYPEILANELKELYYPMTLISPFTLWENFKGAHGGRTHGFNAYAGALMINNFLGVSNPDNVMMVIDIAPKIIDLQYAKGTVATKYGMISVSWKAYDNIFELNVSAPHEYQLNITIPKEYRKGEIIINGMKQDSKVKSIDEVKEKAKIVIDNN